MCIYTEDIFLYYRYKNSNFRTSLTLHCCAIIWWHTPVLKCKCNLSFTTKNYKTQTHRSHNWPGISSAPPRTKPQCFISAFLIFLILISDLPPTSSFPSSLTAPLSLLFLSDGGERWDSWPAGPPPHPEGGRHPPFFSCASLSQYPALLTASTPHNSEWSQMIQHTVGRVTDTVRAGRCSKTDWKEREINQNSFQCSPVYWRSCNPQKQAALFLLKPERHGCSSCWCCHCLSPGLSLSLSLSQALIEKVPQTDKCTETLPHMHTVLSFLLKYSVWRPARWASGLTDTMTVTGHRMVG